MMKMMIFGRSSFKPRLLLVVAAALVAGIVGLLGLQNSFPTGCIMTYMYPTYVPLPAPANTSVSKYGLFLYHEGWKKIDYELKLVQLSGVPVLFIPGNGGSYKQVRSLAAESDRAFNGGPLEESFYQSGVLTNEEGSFEENGIKRVNDIDGKDMNALRKQYYNHLDWFAVDLDGEHSAMDGRILEEHTEYVVQAIHRILDRYKESLEARSKNMANFATLLPKSVILVGHSMGGFVARAAVVHPGLRRHAVQTVVTLSSPHLSPPVATQPSLGYYFSRINWAWRKGYSSRKHPGLRSSLSTLSLSHVVVVSIFGGARDYQVRSKMASLDGLVPSTHGLSIAAPGMLNVWLGMEHQSILWCNQLVVQVSHTLLQMIDQKTGQPFSSPSRRLATFVRSLRSPLPQMLGWMSRSQIPEISQLARKPAVVSPNEDGYSTYSCSNSIKWPDESHEKDLFIETYAVTILAMDGRRRWLDIQKLGSDGRDHFVLVTNLVPCLGIRVHLWPERGSKEGFSVNQRVLEVTKKMVQLPAGPAPRQIEPGRQTEQAPPSGVLFLSSEDLQGFRFITLMVAPRPILSGRPPPAASMAVGQFYKPSEGRHTLPPFWIASTILGHKDVQLVENHPLLVNLTLSLSTGVLPVKMEMKTASCGIRNSVFANEDPGDLEHTSLCKLRCFPPVALVWDPLTGIAVIPNFFSETIVVDSSPALWSARRGSRETTVAILVDPLCAYNIRMSASLPSAATRFLLVHGLEIAGFAVAILLFTLMQQARAWELDYPVPSVLASMEYNLRLPFPFIYLSMIPLIIYTTLEIANSESTSSFASFVLVSIACYGFATGAVAILATLSQIILYIAASVHFFVKRRLADNRCMGWIQRVNAQIPSRVSNQLNVCSSLWVLGSIRSRPLFAVMVLSILLVFFVHPALGLIVVVLVHTCNCYLALYSHQQQNNFMLSSDEALDKQVPLEKVDNGQIASPKPIISFKDAQLEIFNYSHGLLLVHLIAAAMLIPSLVAWGQRLGMDRSLPWFLDASLSFGIILHGFVGSKLDVNTPLVPFPGSPNNDAGLSFVYALAALYSYLAGLALAPYRVFHALAIIGALTTVFRILDRRGRMKGDYSLRRRHFHRH
ncbi:hypothetical protein KP509_35G049700 [Ceratopteris richardii]|uniref:GPI inositol-deacylase n=1 Tax=Ceratopteris richardii TaxID=49495 RepID=A0A8T2QFA3_CERRI|nr:hypothetical protein KP509_35G049700 [Ceratopteris richardii]